MPPKRKASRPCSPDRKQRESEHLHNAITILGEVKQELSHQIEVAEVAKHKQQEEIISLRQLILDAIDKASETKLIFQIPEFHALGEDDEVLDWLDTAKHMLDCALVPADKRVKLAVIRFRDNAANWWRSCKWERERARKPLISTWEELEKEMKSYFLPYKYEHKVLTAMLELKQGFNSVHKYSNYFHELLWKTQHQESVEQTMKRYEDGLEWNIRRMVRMHEFKSLQELVEGAKEAEYVLKMNLIRNHY